MLVFGIVYVTTGILLFLKLRFSAMLGIIFPLIGIITGFFITGHDLSPLLALLFAIDVVVVICCIFLFVKRNK
jgi:predicted Co/Zn/Cd cation transporter (cation efflux family)